MQQLGSAKQLCFSLRPKTMSSFPATVPFVIVVSFLGLIMRLASDVQDRIAFLDFGKQNCNISLSSSAVLIRC